MHEIFFRNPVFPFLVLLFSFLSCWIRLASVPAWYEEQSHPSPVVTVKDVAFLWQCYIQSFFHSCGSLSVIPNSREKRLTVVIRSVKTRAQVIYCPRQRFYLSSFIANLISFEDTSILIVSASCISNCNGLFTGFLIVLIFSM